MPITLLQKGKTDRQQGKLKRDTALGNAKRDRTMGINVSTSMGFENKDFIRNTAKQILKNSGASDENADAIAKNTTYSSLDLLKSDMSVYNASAQITLNNSLKETLKYLQAHSKDKRKKYILGELWDLLGSDEDKYQGELLNFEIDFNKKNIFAA